jgi:cellulose synthase operon protein C
VSLVLKANSNTSISRLVMGLALALSISAPAVAADEEAASPGPSAAAQPSKERLEGAIPEEVEEFKGAQERFINSMDEFERETYAFVDFRESEERGRVRESYDDLINALEDVEIVQRDTAIEKFKFFLERYPDVPYSSHVRFRLAELLFEIASAAWLDESEEYYAEMEALDEDDLDAMAAFDEREEPRIEFRPMMELYRRIIEDNEGLPDDEAYEYLDGAYYMLGWCYYEANSTLTDIDVAIDIYRELIEKRPDSDLADAAHLLLGNYYFDSNLFDEAIAEYEYVYSKGSDAKYYTDAMYQLAWSRYKLSDYDEGLRLFTELLDYSEELELQRGKPSDFAPDAATYMAHTFADISEQSDLLTAVQVAEEYFSRSEPREYEWEVYKELAEVLVQYLRADEGIEVYRKLQNDPRWVYRPENPEFQMNVVTFLGTGLFADPAASGQARLELTQRYNDASEWWAANRSNPEALATARKFIESSLLQVAIEYRVKAQETGAEADYLMAANKYREYLEKFPISDDYYKQQWYLADSLAQGKEYRLAEEEYASLYGNRKNHIYGDGAVYQLMDTRLQIALNEVGPSDKLPESAEVERTYTGPNGNEINVYELTPPHANFVESADTVLAREFQREPGEGMPDYRGAVEERRAKIMYIAAQVLFTHNRFDEARPRLLDLIDNFPRTEEASFAAGLLVDSYLTEGDLDQVRKYTRKFTTMVLGTAEVADPEGKFLSTLEATAFKQAKGLADAGEYKDAADAFLSFLEEFPGSEHKVYALYNAAHYLQEIGKAERANELFEQFVNLYPEHEWSKQLYFRIAVNYESTFDLDKAVDYYERLVDKFPDYIDAANAMYNAAFLKIGLGDHIGAARGFEEYARRFPDQSDKEKVYYRAGGQWEEVGERQALKFYKGYLKSYGEENPEHMIEAMYAIAEIYNKQGNTRAYERQMADILVAFDEQIAKEAELGPNARHYAAMQAFKEIQAAYDDYIKDELTRDDEKDAVLLNETKPEGIKAFKELSDQFIAKYSDFEYATAALFLQGMTLFYYADLGLAVQPPKGLTEDEEWAFLDILEEQFYPKFYEVEEAGFEHMNQLFDLAKTQKKHSVWIDNTYNVLNKRRPADFPAVKNELLGGVDSSVPHTIRPITMEEPEEEEPVEDSEDDATTPEDPTEEPPASPEDSPQPDAPDGE